MAELLAISPRQYQGWEYNARAMNEQAKILCGAVAFSLAPDCAEDWPEWLDFGARLGERINKGDEK
jgi:hypothetical protein